MARGGLIWLILLATFAACGPASGGGPDSAVTPAGAWAEIGTGSSGFEELAAEGEIDLIAGPQGGHHFIVHARIHGLQPGDPRTPGVVENPSTLFSVWSESGEQLDIVPPPYKLGYEEVSDDVYSLASGHIIQVREDVVEGLYGARLRLRVEVTDAAGAKVIDERWVVAAEGPDDPLYDAGPQPDAEPAAWVEIGTGDSEFEPLAEEGDIVRQSGAQGGNHFFLHARMMGLVPEGGATRFRVYNESGARIDFSTAFNLDYESAGGSVYALPYGQIVQLSPVPSIGARVRVTVELTDTDGLQVSDQRWVHVIAP